MRREFEVMVFFFLFKMVTNKEVFFFLKHQSQLPVEVPSSKDQATEISTSLTIQTCLSTPGTRESNSDRCSKLNRTSLPSKIPISINPPTTEEHHYKQKYFHGFPTIFSAHAKRHPTKKYTKLTMKKFEIM